MLGIGIDTLVTFNPFTVAPDTTLDEVVRLMSQHGIHHVPVVDGDSMLVGMVSDLDVSRAFDKLPAAAKTGADDAALLTAALPLVSEVLTQNVRYIAPGDPPEAALELIVENQFHCVPVVYQGRLEGIITSTDFLRELSYGQCALSRQHVSRWVNTSLPRIDAAVAVSEAAALVPRAGYAIVCDGSQPRGVVSQRQLRRARLGTLLADDSSPSRSASTMFHAERVGDLLPIDAACVRPDAILSAAAHEMFARQIQGLLVIDAARRWRGAVTETDLLRAMLG